MGILRNKELHLNSPRTAQSAKVHKFVRGHRKYNKASFVSIKSIKHSGYTT
jgi:hypothetical protein